MDERRVIVSYLLSLVGPAHQLLLPLAAFKCDMFWANKFDFIWSWSYSALKLLVDKMESVVLAVGEQLKMPLTAKSRKIFSLSFLIRNMNDANQLTLLFYHRILNLNVVITNCIWTIFMRSIWLKSFLTVTIESSTYRYNLPSGTTDFTSFRKFVKSLNTDDLFIVLYTLSWTIIIVYRILRLVSGLWPFVA